MVTNTSRFYRDLPGFSQFVDLHMAKHYRRVPDDWFIVICDLRVSTEAIGAGLYQNVNLIGAACISTVRTAVPDDFPFVFGGDGASLLLPEQHLETACDQLSKLQNLAKANFGFDLRVCAVRVGDAHRAGAPVELAKFMATPHLGMALIRGGGLSWAEKNAKSDTARFGVPPAADGAARPVGAVLSLATAFITTRSDTLAFGRIPYRSLVIRLNHRRNFAHCRR